jgi:hypothetical protein
MADVYLTNEAVNITLTSSFNALAEPLLAPLNLPAPTKVPSRFLHSTPENNSLTIQLGPSALLVKLRVRVQPANLARHCSPLTLMRFIHTHTHTLQVMNWHYTETWHTLSISGNVESSASGIDVSWSKYPPPTNNMATVALPGKSRRLVVQRSALPCRARDLNSCNARVGLRRSQDHRGPSDEQRHDGV